MSQERKLDLISTDDLVSELKHRFATVIIGVSDAPTDKDTGAYFVWVHGDRFAALGLVDLIHTNIHDQLVEDTEDFTGESPT